MADDTPDTSAGAGFSDPTAMGLLGLAQGFGQAALPTPYKGGTPLGAMIGMAAGGALKGVQGAQQYAAGQEQLKAAQAANERTKLFLDQWKRGGSAPFGVPDATAGGAGGDTPVLTYADAIRNMNLYSMDPHGGPAARAWGEIAKTLVPQGGGFVGTRSGGVMPVPGADPSAAGRTGAVEGTKAAVDVNKAWAMLSPEAQRKLTEANIDVTKAFRMPQQMVPGNTVATPQQIQQQGAAAQPGPDPFPGYARAIMAAENGSGAPDAQNPNSSATGNGQFLKDTWPSVVAATRPDLLKGRNSAQILALRSNPDLSSQMTEAYARQNGAALAQAGFDPSLENVYLAHHFGPAGAIAALKANPNMPFGAVIPNGADVLKANPYLQGKTVGDVINMVGANARTRAGTANPPTPNAPPIGTPPVGTPTFVQASPQTAEAEAEGKRIAALPAEVNKQAAESQNALNRIALVRQAMSDATKGGLASQFFSPELAKAAAAMKALGISIPGVDPKAVGNSQVANEALTQISGEIMKRLFPQRITNMDLKLYGNALPRYGMDPAALDTLLGQAQQAAQYDVQRGQDMNTFRKQHGTLEGWEPQFYSSRGYGPQFFQAMQEAQGLKAPENPATEQPAGARVQEGSTATGPGGKRMVFRGGQWRPM